MSLFERKSIIESLKVLSPTNSVGGTVQIVLLIAALCAVFSTFFWWIR